MKNAIFIITIISLSLSIFFAIDIQLGNLGDDELFHHKFLLASSSFFTLVGWLLLMLNNQLKTHSDEKD